MMTEVSTSIGCLAPIIEHSGLRCRIGLTQARIAVAVAFCGDSRTAIAKETYVTTGKVVSAKLCQKSESREEPTAGIGLLV